MLLSKPDFESYLNYLREKNYSKNQIYSCYCSLNKFYRWCVVEKILVNNPIAQVSINKPYRSLEICSEADLKALSAYVKNSQTDPSDALLISLVLFFGFTIEQLCLAQLVPTNGDQMRIILATREQTYSRRYKRRHEHLELPATPAWFLKLQQRYSHYWSERYKGIQHISLRRHHR
jgi:site-specific recombinase XerD